MQYFRQWLQKDMVLSCSKKNWDKFAQCGCDCWATTAFTWDAGKEQLALFKASLYIEDTRKRMIISIILRTDFMKL